MDQTSELLSLLYELSLTNLKNLTPQENAKKFIRKLLSRKSLHYGAAWKIEGFDGDIVRLSKIYSMPDTTDTTQMELKTFLSVFKEENFTVLNSSILNDSKMTGQYAYFKLGDFGILELYHDRKSNIDFSKKAFAPFKDVIEQFALSLEYGYSYEVLEKEVVQRKAAELSLLTNEEKYRRIIDNIKLGLLEVDNDEIIQYANQPFLDLTGYELEEVIGENASELFLDADNSYIVSVQHEKRKQGQSGSYELMIKDKLGNKKWAIVSGAPNFNKEGELIGSIGIHLDVTEEKKLKQENEFKDTQLKKLFEKSLDALISIDQEGVIFEWSPQAEKIFGFKSREIIGKRISDTIIPHDFRRAHDEGMVKYRKTGEGPVLNNRIEIQGLRKNGKTFPIELTIFPLKHDEKEYFTAFVRDITEIKESKENMEKALQRQKELNNMKSKFISMTSHELRTPLTTIRSNTELLTYQLENLEKLDHLKLLKNVSRIDNNVERLNQLTNNILMIGKLDSDKIPFNPRAINIPEFIKKEILPDYKARQQEVDYFESSDTIYAELDERLFVHIVTNLIENAIKYSPNGTSPELRILQKPDGIEIKIKDEGIGIPEEDQKKLFETFYRASNVGNIQGTGLGLAIVKQFVELHKGTIKVESEVGKGTTFILNFLNTKS